MERHRGFAFKLLVPPRFNEGQAAVRPQEILENCDFMKTLDQVRLYSQQNNLNPGKLYTKLLDEVEKIKYWKIKVDADTVQKERRLQENKRTIETQRKAIKELQFGNESLTIKLEERISENEDLRNKHNVTRNLCKETFERSTEKMHLFESEREETHHIFMENSGSIQKLIAAFEGLRTQAEADQQEMQKVKVGLQQFEIVKEKFKEEFDMKEKEVAVLQTDLQKQENELQKILLDFHETQKHCKQLKDTTNEQYELLKSSETEKESLIQKLQSVEQCLKESDEQREAIAALLKESKEEYAEMIQSKDFSLQEFSRVKNQQAEKLEQIQTTMQELQNSLASEIQKAEELEDKLIANKGELESKITLLGESLEQSAMKDGRIKDLEDELCSPGSSQESCMSGLELDPSPSSGLKYYNTDSETGRVFTAVCFFIYPQIKVQKLEHQLFSEIEKNKENTCQMEQLNKDITQHEEKYKYLLSNFNGLQSEKKAIEQQFESGSSNVKAIEANIKVSEEKAAKLTREIQRLEEENLCLREEVNSCKTRIQGKYQETETLQKQIEEKGEHLQEEITEKETKIKSVETKVTIILIYIYIYIFCCFFQNKVLKKQIAKEIAKSNELETVINNLYEESQNLKQMKVEDHQKLLNDLESKSTSATELENEVKKLRITTAEAVKNKDEAELKCQQKIANMVALMEKHKSQYDLMVEEKDAELDENKKREMEAVCQKKSLELDLLKNKTDNDKLKQQLKTEVSKKANLQKELSDLKKEMSSMKIIQLSGSGNNQSPALKSTQGKSSDTPKDSFATRHVFDFSESRKTPSHSKVSRSTAVMKNDDKESDAESIRTPCGTSQKNQEIQNGDLKTPQSVSKRIGGTSKIKSYRIRTPPSTEKTVCWKKTIELDPKSDSSDLGDLLVSLMKLFTFASALPANFSAPSCEQNIFKKIQSPAVHKSPGNSLKLAAMKRMRDAGWTAVTGCNKKKKRTNEKIFA
ncbi:synaptonemal complex protein 1 [Labrus mixtus]|uniref:synaptonemal complex protein 1 n=1 Tax=Labrus mixtus TaxID=508554 RepID=UPI0029C07098|nr:synaptonemal complex protein 1 [Labrus mixtus]